LNRCVKLCDFGLATEHNTCLNIGSQYDHTSCVGTMRYMSPEIYQGRNYNYKTDIYSLSLIGEQLFGIDLQTSQTFEANESVFKTSMQCMYRTLLAMMSTPNWRQRPECREVLAKSCDSGFGNRLAFRLNSMGFRVYACVLDTESTGAQDLSNKCKFLDEICIVRMDVTIDEDIDRCHEFVVADLQTSGRVLWSVVNNAGRMTYGHLEWGKFSQYTKVFDVNVFGVVRVTRKFIPLIRQSKVTNIIDIGRLVFTTSQSGRVAYDNLGPYCMSKAAVIAFTDVLRREMRPFGVRVSNIEPLLFKTAMYALAKPELNKNWSETEGQVREAYGQDYYERQIHILDFGLTVVKGSTNLDIVCNDLVDAVASRRPNKYYTPVNAWWLHGYHRLARLTPQWLIDHVFYAVNSTKPTFMHNNSNL
ncbi:unnamed protein product, partial [Medioppia subpectinata]